MSDEMNKDSVIEKALTAAVIEQRRARRWGIFWKALFFVYFTVILLVMIPRDELIGSAEEHVAVVNVIGMISPEDSANAESINKSLRLAFENKNAKAVILRINSPGGTAVQSAQIYDEVRRLKKLYPNKKTIAVIEDLGASGAYFIASATDSIYANRASFVGSIGALMAGFGFTDLLQKIGVERRVYKAGQEKDMMDPFKPVTPEQVQIANQMVEDIHKQFIKAVNDGRGKRLKQDPEIFSGRVWTGEQAKDLGLIDGFSSVNDVARDVIGIKNTVDYTESTGLFERLSQKVGTEVGRGMVKMFQTASVSLTQ